jgi:hypothetical protein
MTPTTVRRSTVERLKEAIEKRRAKLAEARAEILALEERETETARASLKSDPLKSAFTLRSPAQEAQRKRAELGKTVANLETEIVLLEAELAEADAALAERRLGEAILQARKLGEEEKETVRQAGALISSMLKPWNARVQELETRRALAERVRTDGLVQAVAGSRPDLAAKWEEASVPTPPEAVTFAAFLNALVEAALADRPDVEAEREAVDALNARRRAFAKRDPGGFDDLPLVPVPTIRTDPLQELVPDLRADVQGFDATIARRDEGEGEVEGLREAGFGLGAVAYGSDGALRVPWRRSPGGEAA